MSTIWPTDRTKPWPLWRRLAIQFGIEWKVLPQDLTIKEWLFSPSGHFTKPGDVITYGNVPREVGPHFIKPDPKGDPLRANYFWMGFAIRILGFDVGAAIFYRCRSAF